MCNNMRLTVLSSYKLLFLCAVIFQQANAGLPTRKKSGYQFSQQEYLLSSDFWENDDWIIKESSSLLTRPHFEAHFEEFVIKKRKEIFVNFEKSYSFSVKGTTDIVFFVSAESSQFYYPYQINDEKIWTTFTVSVKDGMLFIYENYTTLIQQVTYVPKTLIIETPIPANFKIYDYEYKEATSDTKGQLYINKLRIPDSGEVYLILSVSMCDTCDLIATYKNTNCFMHSSNDHNTERWASYKIKINPNIYKEVILARRNHYSNNAGYWKLHLRLTNRAIESVPEVRKCDGFTRRPISTLSPSIRVLDNVVPEVRNYDYFTRHRISSTLPPSFRDTITFQKISPPTSNDSTKAYFVLSKNDLVNSTDEIIAYALFLLEEHVDIQSKNGSWNGTLKNWPSTPKNSLQLTPNFWNPFLEDRHICNFIIGASSGCCRVHCYNEPLKPSTSYWLMVRTLTNQAYNDSPLLFFQTASEDSYHYNTYYISVGVLILVILVTVVLVYIIYKIRRRNNQATITQEEDMMLIVNQKPLETTVIDFNSLQNHCSQPTFLTSLKIQFNSISDPVPHSSCRIGLQRKNINKNRDRNRIIPYDTNRVVLKPMEGVGTEDYINASYIDGYDRSKAYIACQSPKFCTIKDFWRMIWQENVSVIIMATNFFEHKKRMCAEYWPQSESEVYEYGEITIKLLRETTFELYAYQELEIAYGDESKNIRHIHFMWSFDDSNMFYPNDVLPVVKLIRQQYENSSGPIVFHSGYGTGGVGILILCDLALQMIRKDNKVDFFSLTRTLRDQRASMITNMEHYIFSHLLMNEYSLEYSNPFQYSIGQNIKHDDIKQQFNYLETLRQYDNIFQEVSLQYCIPRHPFESVIVARYGQRRKYLISREPKEEQLIDFWKMVARKSIGWVLFLNKELPLSTRVTGSIEVVNITRKQVVNTAYGLMTEASLLIYNKISKKKIHDHKLYIFQFNNWKENQLLPNSVCNFISVINYIHSKTAKEKLVLVSCSDGFTACGLFVVFSYIVEKYENEVEIDVCNAIRLARRSGRSFVSRTKQLTFIYKCIRDYIENYDKYQQIINSK
ncbi:receptor-type tyrosine-protein phosphatase epsilon-like isoform X4 [Zophobas morio]|uniref:receptor-type tyrosine-protein phosphatase epsilon-like isoform X4 n=1 Tax=Zophobas morio TaxID=2755281 RepID=UPI003082CE0A